MASFGPIWRVVHYSPFGPLTSLISMILSVRLLLRRIHSLTRPPASFSASTAPLWVTSLTSVSFTRTMQSFTLHSKVKTSFDLHEEIIGEKMQMLQSLTLKQDEVYLLQREQSGNKFMTKFLCSLIQLLSLLKVN